MLLLIYFVPMLPYFKAGRKYSDKIYWEFFSADVKETIISVHAIMIKLKDGRIFLCDSDIEKNAEYHDLVGAAEKEDS